MPIPTHLKPLPTPYEADGPVPAHRDNDHRQHHRHGHGHDHGAHGETHPLAHSEPLSPVHQAHLPQRHTHFEPHHHHQRHHSRGEREGKTRSRPQSPHRLEHEPHETVPMLQQEHHHGNHSHHHRSQPSADRSDPHVHHQANQQLHAEHPHAAQGEASHLSPPGSPRTPKSPTPLSKRLLWALTNKPTLSKTWEKRSYADQMKTAPMQLGNTSDRLSAHGHGKENSPMSLQESLPFVEGYPHEGSHAHSAPNLPAPAART
uniref:Uncharacterized protein n=1 Tax=Kwoniella dejecticola CBS 10117 TaxID=1296121 RepID=A0A1A6ABF1_9TREE|nr:uncharacterized protein I303_01581 [Kwoniella dejecticola CBS 10117]OBR87379.1 hypothetical protein I303_01581 [Kwoniella dejecticola CBS 10117]